MLNGCTRYVPAECGDIVFIGSTTENPYAAMTPAIVSRCRVFEFRKLEESDIEGALKKAAADRERGLGNMLLKVDEEAYRHFASMAAGDLRVAYNALELAALTTSADKEGVVHITLRDAEESIQRKALSYDENLYYDMLSAFCKSLRGSDPDAALYYMHRLINGGCDPILIARRLVAHASEDVGMADSRALVVAVSAMTAFEKMGKPEGLIPLTHAVIYVCEAPKSNSVIVAMERAIDDAVKRKDDAVPPHLKNAVYGSKEDKEKSAQYKYVHDYGGYVKQQYLPDSLVGAVYYEPKDAGEERAVKERRRARNGE